MFSSIITNPIIYLLFIFTLWALSFVRAHRLIDSSQLSQKKRLIKRKWIQFFLFILFSYIIFTVYFSSLLLPLLSVNRLDKSANIKPDVIVMARGGSKINSNPEITGPNSSDLLRLRSAIWWQRQYPDIQLVIAGKSKFRDDNKKYFAILKQYAINQGVDANLILIDDFSTTTLEHPIGLKRLGFKSETKVGIVSDYWHEKRLKMSFKPYYPNLIFIPKKVSYLASNNFSDYLPSSDGVRNIEIFLHEVIGLVWYFFKLKLNSSI